MQQRYRDDPRVRLFQNDRNIGLVPNFNRALTHARGAFVAWLSADDWILPGHLARHYALFVHEPHLDVVYSRTYAADASGNVYAVKGDPALFPVDYVDARDELPAMLTAINQVCLPGALFRRELFEELGPMDESLAIAADWELAVRLALARKRFGYLAEPSACVRAHGANASGSDWLNSGRAFDEFVRILERYLDHPEMARIRGYELQVVAFLDWFAARGAGPADEAAALRERVAAARGHLVRLHERYDPARVREHRVSIAMPMTARPAALVRAIDSIARQTFPNWEILVVDQGVVPVRELLRGHPAAERIACVRLPVQRPAGAARNIALRMARGEYVTFLDEDNVVAPDHLETLVGTIERTGADVAVAAARLVVDRADFYGIKDDALATVEGLFRGPNDPAPLGVVANALPLNAVLHHRRFYERAGHFSDDALILEDFDYLMRLQSTAYLTFTGATTLNVHVRLRFASQALGSYAHYYLAMLDALYASREVTPELASRRATHRAIVAAALERRAELAETAAGMVECILALTGRTVVQQPAAAPAGC